MSKFVYSFGGGKADGKAQMKELLGGKGANLAEMANLGIPVPAGFTITTDVCMYYYQHVKKSSLGFGPIRRAQVHARNDGNRAQRGFDQ
jgi:phosphoenolpyruvate synthase/pyruvate phosphate dikinase